jgi:hypothetical protein
MEMKFNVTKEGRKALVRAVGAITGREAVYKGTPGFEFAVGDCIIDRYGTIASDGRMGTEDIRRLLTGLAECGFSFEGDIDEIAPVVSGRSESAADGLTNRGAVAGGGCEGKASRDGGFAAAAVSEYDGDPVKLSVNMPLLGFTVSAQDNLEKMVAAKAWILKRMAETDALPIVRDERHLRFPWFKPGASAAEVDAYSRLIAGMCETAKTKKRVMAAERLLEDGENEKFKARCFLLSIGFIGDRHKQARKVLLSPFSGSGSHKLGGGGTITPNKREKTCVNRRSELTSHKRSK